MKVEIAVYGSSSYTDITDLIKFQGVSWSSNSVDAPNAGRSLDGYMNRKLIGFKDKFEIQCIQLTTEQLDALTSLLEHEWLSVKITTSTGTVTRQMYPGATIKSAFCIKRKDGTELWDGYSFSLIEK